MSDFRDENAISFKNIANNVARTEKTLKKTHRVTSWQVRGVLWRESQLERVRGCGRHSILPNGQVGVRANGVNVGYSGLSTCGSVWACPICNAKIQGVRRLEVGTILSLALSEGSGAFGAYTISHHKGDDLGLLWEALSYCWSSVNRDRKVREIRNALDYLGTIKAVEVTEGENGWHPHLHPLHLFGSKVTRSDVEELFIQEFRAWKSAASRKGLNAPLEIAQHLHLITGENFKSATDLGNYFTKATYTPRSMKSISFEMTSTQTKSKTRATDSRTPWDILNSWATGELDNEGDLILWHEWEIKSKGKKALTYSHGLKKLFLGTDTDLTDEEIAETEIGTIEDTGFYITDWSVIRKKPALGAVLLETVTAQGNWKAGREFCDKHSIPFIDAVLSNLLDLGRK